MAKEELNKHTPSAPAYKGIDLGSIPDGWVDEEELEPNVQSERSNAEESPNPSAPSESFTDDDLSHVEAASSEQINAPTKRSDEEDLNEQFDRYSKASTQSEGDLRKRMYRLDQKLHSVDFEVKERAWIRASPFVLEVADVMALHLGIPKAEVYQAAVLMFYRNCFSSEKRMLGDMGLMLDASTLQNKELAIEASALEDLANLAIQAEASPLNQTAVEDES
jgi:hypothetical protein